uniref:Uncharacterized protein n=1 Tax=Arundo donax TaxID=35708 RepID=A0A0A8XWK6_ARUDO
MASSLFIWWILLLHKCSILTFSTMISSATGIFIFKILYEAISCIKVIF